MGQLIFFALFIVALLAGAFAYFAPSQKAINPMKFVMENSGYDSMDTLNHKRVQQLNMLTRNGLMQIHRKTEDIALEQNKFLGTIQDQQQVLKNASKGAEDIMLEAQRTGGKGNKDILRLKALALEMQDEQRLLVANGQGLIVLNDQLTKGRQWIADQIDLANINNETSLQTLQQRYALLQSQAIGLFDSEERSRNLLKDAQENSANSRKLFNDSLQQTQDLIEQERQKVEDQEWINQQHMADQQQRIQDQQAQRNK